MNLVSAMRGEDLVVTVRESRIDALSAVQFKDSMRELTAAECRRVILDLSEVDCVDSSGLGAVVATMKHLGPERTLELAALTPKVEAVFRLTRMDTVMRIHRTIDEAVDAEPA